MGFWKSLWEDVFPPPAEPLRQRPCPIYWTLTEVVGEERHTRFIESPYTSQLPGLNHVICVTDGDRYGVDNRGNQRCRYFQVTRIVHYVEKDEQVKYQKDFVTVELEEVVEETERLAKIESAETRGTEP